MTYSTTKGTESTNRFHQAQAGDAESVAQLMSEHDGLVHYIVRQQWRGMLSYEQVLQEGRIGLWKAVLGFDPDRGIAFSTYAGVAIERHMWRLVARMNRPQGGLPPRAPPDPREIAEENVWLSEVHQVLREAVSRLPERLRQVIIIAYGLDGEAPRTLIEIGEQFGVSREMARYWRNDGLLLLRLPAFSGRLRHLCDQDSRVAYARTQALNRAWLQQKRGSRGKRRKRQ